MPYWSRPQWSLCYTLLSVCPSLCTQFLLSHLLRDNSHDASLKPAPPMEPPWFWISPKSQMHI